MNRHPFLAGLFACVALLALANPDIAELGKRVKPGITPVIIAERVQWVKPEVWQAERDDFLRQVEAWRKDREKLDTDRERGDRAGRCCDSR